MEVGSRIPGCGPFRSTQSLLRMIFSSSASDISFPCTTISSPTMMAGAAGKFVLEYASLWYSLRAFLMISISISQRSPRPGIISRKCSHVLPLGSLMKNLTFNIQSNPPLIKRIIVSSHFYNARQVSFRHYHSRHGNRPDNHILYLFSESSDAKVLAPVFISRLLEIVKTAERFHFRRIIGSW